MPLFYFIGDGGLVHHQTQPSHQTKPKKNEPPAPPIPQKDVYEKIAQPPHQKKNTKPKPPPKHTDTLTPLINYTLTILNNYNNIIMGIINTH